MSNPIDLKGQCVCGEVRISAKSEKNSVGACHCRTCRRWGGGPLMEIDCGQAVKFESEAQVAIYASSDWAERAFCRNCGTHLFYRLKQTGQHIVPIGLFDNAPELVFEHQVFVDEKPSFYSFANETHNMTGAEVFAMFGAPD